MKVRARQCLSVLALACAASLATAATPSEINKSMADLQREMKVGNSSKLGTFLQGLADKSSAQSFAGSPQRMTSAMERGRVMGMRDGKVSISAFAKSDPKALLAQLVELGMTDAKIYGTSVSGMVAPALLESISKLDPLRFVRPNMAKTNVGLTTSQGDRAQRSNLARGLFNVDGRNVRVGVLSDSYNCSPSALVPGERFTNAAQDIASNDLPADVLVLEDLSPVPSFACSDEGRAMMQIIHDVAPGAPLAFATAFNGQEAFGQSIIDLAAAGSKVIVDDVIYFAEPMFLNGPIAQAVNTVKDRGVAYFSSAGNQGRQAYQAKFVDSGELGVSGGPLHSFAASGTADSLQSITVQAGADTLLVFQWDEPWFSVSGGAGSASDVDIYFFTESGDFVESCFFSFGPVCQFAGFDFNVGGDPVEFAEVINFGDEDVKVNVAMELFEGPQPQFLKYVYYEFGFGSSIINEFDTKSGTVYGHANAEGAEAVGAAAFGNTTAFGPVVDGCAPACLERFSSAGGTPLLLNELGERLRFPKIQFKPGITAPDGANTTFFIADINVPAVGEPDGFPNFFGTSAAAPHAAAVAALMLDQRARDLAAGKFILGPRLLSPDIIYAAMRLTARDIKASAGLGSTAPTPINGSLSFDFDSGFGMLDASAALLVTRGL